MSDQADPGAASAGEFASFLASFASSPEALRASPDLSEMRALAAALRMPLNQGGPVMAATIATTINASTGPLRARIHRPIEAAVLPALVYLHGGGWTLLDLDTHDRLMREYAAASGRAVIGIDYPRAPEHAFPVPVLACAAAFEAITAGAAAFGVAAARIALGGDSAGANLALAAALQLRDRGGPAPEALLLNYGVYDSSLDSDSCREFASAPGPLTAEKMAWFWSLYCPLERDRSHPLAAPIHSRLNDLPPTYLVIAASDILRDENRAMAAALRTAGVAVKVEEVAGAPHGFLEATALSQTSRAVVRRSARWLRRVSEARP